MKTKKIILHVFSIIVILLIIILVVIPVIKRNIANNYIKHGHLCRDNNEYDKAITFYQKALNIVPNYPKAELYIVDNYIKQGEILMEKGDYVNARAIYQEALINYPSQEKTRRSIAESYIQQGNEYKNNGYNDEAIVSFKEAIKINYNHLGNCYDYNIYYTALQAIIDVNLQQGIEYRSNDNYDEAIISFQEALGNIEKIRFYKIYLYGIDESILNNYFNMLKQNITETYLQEGNYFNNNKQYNEAIQFYQKAISTISEYTLTNLELEQSIYQNIADAYIKQGKENMLLKNYDKVKEYYQKAYKAYYSGEIIKAWNEFVAISSKRIPNILNGNWICRIPSFSKVVNRQYYESIIFILSGNTYIKDTIYDIFPPTTNYESSPSSDMVLFDGKYFDFIDGTRLMIEDNELIDIETQRTYTRINNIKSNELHVKSNESPAARAARAAAIARRAVDEGSNESSAARKSAIEAQ